jgi:pimeloyl-ACP methyl ester carboxylesterase
MPPALTISEALKDESCWHFAGTHSEAGWTCAWVARRRGWGDDLILQRPSQPPLVVAARVKVAGPPVFIEDGGFAVVIDDALKVGNSYGNIGNFVVEPAKGETMRGSIRWVGDAFLVVVKRADGRECLRRYSWTHRGDFDEVYVASKCGSIGSFDGWPGSSAVALVHRLANAMVAEVIVVDEAGQRSVARDGRVEYAAPSLGCLVNDIPGTNGRRQLVCRFGGLDVASGVGAKLFADDAADAPQRLADGPTAGLEHGLFVLDRDATRWERVDIQTPDFQRVDVAARSYGPPIRDMCVNAERTGVVVTGREESGVGEALYEVEFSVSGDRSTGMISRIGFDPGEQGAVAPVAAVRLADVLFVKRSPDSWGDLHAVKSSSFPDDRLTYTMPLAFAAKLRTPDQVKLDDGCHALVYWPTTEIGGDDDDDDTMGTDNNAVTVRPLVWGHGGPLCSHALEPAPLFQWLADLGHVVVVPHFPGSVGFGLAHMDAVRGEGCGKKDFESVCAAGTWCLKDDGLRPPEGISVDRSRGVGYAGHSWGGYLGLLAATRAESPFSCVVASAGIADWAVQQKCTEVRYYDRWLMGGWVYEEAVRGRVARANPEPVVRVPLLLAHGQADTDCPFAQIKTFAEKAASPLLETLFLEGEGHGPSGWSEEHRKAYFEAISTFLRQNLKPWNCVDNPHGDVTAY